MTALPRTAIATQTILALESPDLGNRSYIVNDGRRAAVVDPPRDFDRVLALCARHGLSIDWVVETHIHNDYVSGGLHLARTVGARYGISAAETVDYPRVALRDDSVLSVGDIELHVHPTPGHTFGHIAFSVSVEGRTTGLLSGGSLLFGAVGRTDLCGAEHTRRLTALQHETAHRLVRELPADVALHPTHGFGSGCAVGRVGNWTSGTLADEARRNPACVAASAEEFAERLLTNLYRPPRSYARIGPLNRAACAPIDLSPPQMASAEQMRDYALRGAWVVDVRDRWMFTSGHIPRSINVPLQRGFSEWLGRVVPAEARIALVADDRAQLEQAQRALARLGIDRPVVATILTMGATSARGLQQQRMASFADLAAELRRGARPVIVDVRRPDETQYAHIEGAILMPL
ncbi:MAG: MBL fold metallo-hydrolase, partial [Aldersonia sp.]|nr:MBL fold metallo-hydrolase [Aldersonia sp.]